MECVNISITDDMALENDEEMFLGLASTLDPDVTLTPAVTIITIIDNDGWKN